MINKKLRLSVLGLSAILFFQGNALAYTSFEEASVLSVEPVIERIEQRVPAEQCRYEETSSPDPRFDRQSGTPGIIGAIVGGAVGNAVGSNKSSKRVGAVAGALLGATVAKDVNRKRHENEYGNTRQVCRTVYRTERAEEIVGYDVSYSYNGTIYTSRMDYDPGQTLRLRVNVTPAN
jgi:uncharacterized protein YcfJ